LSQQHGAPTTQLPAATGSALVQTQCVHPGRAQQFSAHAAAAVTPGREAMLAVSPGQCRPGTRVLLPHKGGWGAAGVAGPTATASASDRSIGGLAVMAVAWLRVRGVWLRVWGCGVVANAGLAVV